LTVFVRTKGKRVYRGKGGKRGGLKPTQNQELTGGEEREQRINGERKKRGSSIEIWSGSGSVLVMVILMRLVMQFFYGGDGTKKWIDGFD
jgi:hypothetical protein